MADFDSLMAMAEKNTFDAARELERRRKAQEADEERQRNEERRRQAAQKNLIETAKKLKQAENREHLEQQLERKRKAEREKWKLEEEKRKQQERFSDSVHTGGRNGASFQHGQSKPARKASQPVLSFDELLEQADKVDSSAFRLRPPKAFPQQKTVLKMPLPRSADQPAKSKRDASATYALQGKERDSRQSYTSTSLSTTRKSHSKTSSQSTEKSAFLHNANRSLKSSSTSTRSSNISANGGKTASVRLPSNNTTIKPASINPSLSLKDRIAASALAPPQPVGGTKRDRRSIEEIQMDLWKRKGRTHLLANAERLQLESAAITGTAKVAEATKKSSEGLTARKGINKSALSSSSNETKNQAPRNPPTRPSPWGTAPITTSNNIAAQKRNATRGTPPITTSNNISAQKRKPSSPPPDPRALQRRQIRERSLSPVRSKQKPASDPPRKKWVIGAGPFKEEVEEISEENTSSIIRNMFSRGKPARTYYDDDESDDMEADASDILREEARSSRIAKQEDQREEELIRLEEAKKIKSRR